MGIYLVYTCNHGNKISETIPAKEKELKYTFNNSDADTIDTKPLLFQYGYLTIDSYDNKQEVFQLKYPNEEIKASLQDELRKRGNNVIKETAKKKRSTTREIG